ncbi:MAG: YiiD C-terminal domain-containing protein [Sumerlaeia bacterium]
MMTPAEMQAYLHEHIPLSAAMAVRVREASAQRVLLEAPLAPNINHRQSVFGGSLNAVATLACWSWVRWNLECAGHAQARIVIQRNEMDFDLPALRDFSAECAHPGEEAWGRFLRVLERRRKARLAVEAAVQSGGALAGRFRGDFVALLDAR